MKKDVYQEITDKIIEEMEKGQLPWQKSWDGKIGTAIAIRPQNAVTGEPYHKGNAMYLSTVGKKIDGGKDPRFCTFAAAKEQGWYVRKGEHGFAIVRGFWADKDKNGLPLAKEDQHWTKTYSTVFHASQFYMIKDNEKVPIPVYEPKRVGYTHEETIQMAEDILGKSQAKIFNDQADEAFYRPFTDDIHLPPREAFPKLEQYYSVALHELGHWTGHESRLNRNIENGFGSVEYAKEELRAEMASVYLSMETGLPFDPTNHAAYTQSWLKTLKDDKNEFFKAAKDAEAIAEYVLDLAREKTLDKEKMEVEIYQAGRECPWKFRDLPESGELDFKHYTSVWKGSLEKESLDDIYMRFNMDERPADFKGHSLSVSDVVVINGNYHYCNSIGFTAMELDQEKMILSAHQLNEIRSSKLGESYQKTFLKHFAEGVDAKTIDEKFIEQSLYAGQPGCMIKKTLAQYSPAATTEKNYAEQSFRKVYTPELKKVIQKQQIMEQCL